MIQYRNVQCPYCDHVFMFHKDSGEWGLGLYPYRMKDTGEPLWNAVCPKCGEELLVKEHELLAMDPNDERVEKRNKTGIT